MTKCGLHCHGERWARAALERARKRGESSMVMRWCERCEAWHVGRLVSS